MSLNSISPSMQSVFDTVYQYIKNKSSKHKWQSGLLGGSVLFFTTRYIFNKLHTWYYQLPPGPMGAVPAIGNTFRTIFNQRWHIEWALYYGPCYAFYEFNTLTVVINEASTAKQILSKSFAQDRDFSNTKPENRKYWNMLSAEDNTPSFIATNGREWSKMRQLMHSKLVRQMNTNYVNQIINESITNELEPELNDIIDNKQNTWLPREVLSHLAFNIIFRANFGKNVGFRNNKLCKQLAQDLVDIVSWKIVKRSAFLFLFPRAAPWFLPRSFLQPCYDIKKRINDSIKELIKQRDAANADKDGVKDKDDMTFMDETREMVQSERDQYNESQEIADIFLMFLAGTDTTSISTEWGLLLLARQPDIQQKVRNELMSVLEKNHIDYKSDSSNIVYDIKLLLQLPLFRACIHEILRISCVARTGVQHKLNKPTWITTGDGQKYFIPNGTRIAYNVEAIHYNVLGNEQWKGKHPQRLCLENWLKEDSGKFYQNPSFITFGHGKRDCIGKQLAMKEMRVILGYLLINYEFSLEEKYMKMESIPNKGGVRGGVAKPYPEIPLIVKSVHT